MNTATPKTIPEYLEQLRYELRSADPALLQDALYDAEEYLRSELAENPGTDEATLLAVARRLEDAANILKHRPEPAPQNETNP